MTRRRRKNRSTKGPSLQQLRDQLDDLTWEIGEFVPIQPNHRLILESGPKSTTGRLIDIVAPIGHGQRVLITSPPKAGKTTILKNISKSISINHPDTYQVALLIDERPEEATDFARSLDIQVEASTADKRPIDHITLAETVFVDAMQRLLNNENVVILLDSITRLARAYNVAHGDHSRTLSGGISAGALDRPRQLFGAARNIEGGGSITIIATALIDTGSKMDDVIFQEFKGTGNSELVLSRKLAEKRLFPAITISESGTRREDCLFDAKHVQAISNIRRKLADLSETDAIEWLLTRIKRTNSNEELLTQFF